MTKWADYCVSKLSLRDGLIDKVAFYKDNGDALDADVFEQKRPWMVQQVNAGKTFCSITKNENGTWSKLGEFSYDGTHFKWYIIPENITRRKTFVSYYHHDDQSDREKFENLFGDLVVSKSVDSGDINSDNCDEYIKQLIQNDYLTDTTVLVVLIGAKTHCRMHVDWEIAGALNYKVGESYAGLLGLFLPSHPSYGSDKYSRNSIPQRLNLNAESGYAILRDWTDDRTKIQEYIELAFSNRVHADKIVNKKLLQMTKNTCD